MLRHLSAALGLALGLFGRRPAGTVIASHQAGAWSGDVVVIGRGEREISGGWEGASRPVDPAYRLLPNAPVIRPGRAIWPGGRH